MSLYILSFIHFFLFLVFLSLSVYVVYKLSKSLLNWIAAIFIFFLGLWSFAFIFIHHPDTSRELATFFLNYFVFSTFFLPSLFLWFVVALLNKNDPAFKNVLFYFSIFAIPLFLYYEALQGKMMILYETSYGWNFSWSNHFSVYLFFTQYSLFVFLAIFLLVKKYFSLNSLIEKRQIFSVLLSTSFFYLLGSLINVVFPFFGISFPDVANIGGVIWVFGLFYAITRYKFLIFSFSDYADDIISIISESVILLDNNNNIVKVNKAVLNILGIRESELYEKKIDDFLKAYNLFDYLKRIKNGSSEGMEQGHILDKHNNMIPIIFSASRLLKNKQSLGIALVFSDISELMKTKKKTEGLNKELENKIQELEKFKKVVIDRELKLKELQDELREIKK